MNKKIAGLLCTIIMVIIFASLITIPAVAEEPINVLLNGTPLLFDVPPQIIDDRTMVPMRVIFESLGADVTWEADTQTIRAAKNHTLIILQIDNHDMIITPNTTASATAYTITLDVPPQLVGGRTLVPVRAVAEGLNARVDWDEGTKTVVITQGDELIDEISTAPEQADSTAPQDYQMGDKSIPSLTAIVGARNYVGMQSEPGSVSGLTMHYYFYSGIENPKQDAEQYRRYLTVESQLNMIDVGELQSDIEDDIVYMRVGMRQDGVEAMLPMLIIYSNEKKSIAIVVPEETALTMRYGEEAYGYITIPAGWANFTDIGLAQKGIPHVGLINRDGSIINLIIIGHTTASLEQVAAASMLGNIKKTTLGGFEAYQLSAYYEYDDTYLYMWYFFDQDGTLHNITAEGPSDKIEQVVEMIEETFSLTN